MRLRHIKGAKEKIEASPYFLLEETIQKGNWHQIFQNTNPIYVEIGMGKGQFLYEQALQNPHINFIGIEKYDSVIVRAIERIEEKPLSNLKMIRMDAEHINQIFDHEVDKIYLNFSDPWPKDRHAKRRLTSPHFLKQYAEISRHLEIEMKTDNCHLMEYSIITFHEFGFQFKELFLDLHQSKTNIIMTEYEQKFVKLGKPIYYICVMK